MTAMINDPSPGARGRGTRRMRSAGKRTSGHLREVFGALPDGASAGPGGDTGR
jgi:hypothetical protein